MNVEIRDIILNALEEQGFSCTLTEEDIIFVDKDDKSVAIHMQDV